MPCESKTRPLNQYSSCRFTNTQEDEMALNEITQKFDDIAQRSVPR
ncbi:hypothetical protein ACEQUB_00927 [Ralstonia syzygii]